MNHEKESDQAQMEFAPVPEADSLQSVGMVLVVLDGETLDTDDPKVALIQELQSKDASERRAGQLSLPAETRKVEEGWEGNLLGAVAELTDSDDVIGRLQVIPDMFVARGLIKVGGMPADVAFMILDDSSKTQLKPVDGTEVENAGWQSMSSIQRMNGEIRQLSHDSMDQILSGEIVELIRAGRDQAIPLSQQLNLGADFSIVSFINNREATNKEDLLQ